METNWYRKIPKLDLFMETEEMKALADAYGYSAVLGAARQAEEEVREILKAGMLQGQQSGILSHSETPQELLGSLPARVREILQHRDRKRMQRVINATGVILHTNLGRAPFDRELAAELADLMAGYSNLEYDLETGGRGSRYSHFEEALCRLTGAEAAAAVNNNAGAVLVMLAALTSGREVIVSRGELVEIGGKFRVPEVMEQSGTHLTEVGTTNRTYIRDYENAVNENTAAFLKVHTSNFQISGFTCAASVEELAALGAEKGIPVLVDLGSGSLVDFENTKFTEGAGEPTVREILEKGADLVAFSGDKLLGGPQAGILAGKKELIQKISSHPLMRALRIDKFTAAALDRTFAVYERKQEWTKIPALEMMSRPVAQMEEMAEQLLQSLKEVKVGPHLEIIRTETPPGGGSLPGKKISGVALSITLPGVSADELQRRLRTLTPPVIARIENDRVLLEMRTIFPDEIPLLAEILPEVL